MVQRQLRKDEEDYTDYGTINWRGFEVVVGPGKAPYFLDEIEARRTENESNMILIAGPPGRGKSYFALKLAQIFDKKFNVDEQVCFDRLHLLHLISAETPLKYGQVILVDEAQFMAGRRHWYEEIQKDLMDNLEAVRSKGFIIIIVALHLHILDIILQKYVLSFMVYMERRGEGTVYSLFTPRFSTEMFRKRLGLLKLDLPDSDRCGHDDCIRCKLREECSTDRAIYERKKRMFLAEMTKDSIEKQQKRTAKKPSWRDLAPWVYEQREKIKRGRKKMTVADIREYVLQEKEIELSRRDGEMLKSYCERLESKDAT